MLNDLLGSAEYDNSFRGGLGRDASGSGSVNDKKHLSGQNTAKGLAVGESLFGGVGNIKAKSIV